MCMGCMVGATTGVQFNSPTWDPQLARGLHLSPMYGI